MYDTVSFGTRCVHVSGSGHIQVEAALSRGGIGFCGLEKGAPIFCFRAVGAKWPARASNRELGRGGAAV